MADISRSQGLMSGAACPMTTWSLKNIVGTYMLVRSIFDTSTISFDISKFKNSSWDGILKLVIHSQCSDF